MAMLPRRACAWTVLFTFSAAIGLGWMVAGHQGPDDDAACRPAAVSNEHAHSSATFEAPPKAPVTHCPFCHWQRAVGGASAVTLQSDAVDLEPIAWILPRGHRAARSAALDAHLSRGPPSNS